RMRFSQIPDGEPVANTPDPCASLVNREELELARHAFAQLTPEEREILFLVRCKDLGFREIGNQLALSPDAARMRYNRAREHFGQLLRNRSRFADFFQRCG